jgi:hypothetical protein
MEVRMSHLVTIKTEIKDLAAVGAACRRLGWTLKEGQSTYAWFGESVGDYPLPEGLTVADLGKCDHSIGVPGAEYEIGLVKRGQRLMPVWDFWRSGGLSKDTGNQLAQAYAVEKTKAAARNQGHLVTETTMPDGKIRLTLSLAGGA